MGTAAAAARVPACAAGLPAAGPPAAATSRLQPCILEPLHSRPRWRSPAAAGPIPGEQPIRGAAEQQAAVGHFESHWRRSGTESERAHFDVEANFSFKIFRSFHLIFVFRMRQK